LNQEIPIRVRGDGFNGRTVKPDAQAAFVRRTQAALRDAVRFKTLRSTRMEGRPFDFLSKTWDIDQAPWQSTDDGDTLLIFQVPRICDSAPRLFEQGTLFEEDRLQPDWTAFDLLGQIISSVQTASANDMSVDYGMLASIESYGQAIRRGLDVAAFEFNQGSQSTATIDIGLIGKAHEALELTPTPRLVRIVGNLDMLRMSDHLFQLIATGTTRVRGVWSPDKILLKDFLGKDVLLEGIASFRPDGSIASIHAHAVREATDLDIPFRELPTANAGPLNLTVIDQTREGFDRVIGKWPGDESDEAITSWLREIS
jgi:hypothetical protein